MPGPTGHGDDNSVDAVVDVGRRPVVCYYGCLKCDPELLIQSKYSFLETNYLRRLQFSSAKRLGKNLDMHVGQGFLHFGGLQNHLGLLLACTF